uniref:Glycosyltransferase family 92 protein n=1 Tax=Caenorhabditis tropicalis TaxID=1561998 RepID=A0A1I7V020_9PELO
MFVKRTFWKLSLPGNGDSNSDYIEPIENGIVIDPTRRLSRKLPVSHVFITSAYYYPTSKSLGQNAIALNMVVDSVNFNVEEATYNVVGSNGTHEKLTVATSKVEGVPSCRYTTAMARTNTVENLMKLEMESNGVKVEVPFKMARYTAPKPVIICISPQFVAEQWQMFLMHVHVANRFVSFKTSHKIFGTSRFGGHLHMYITSMVESYFELMREYEKRGYLTLDYWLRMKFEQAQTPYFEPNGNIEWRNQAGAETDCLLQYKEAAEYIAFFDMDDILFPATYPTYLEEFNAEWALQPNATSLLYGRREHEFIKAQTMSEFSFTELVESLRSSPTVKRGKVVVKPETYNHTWIHYSWHEDISTRHNVSFPHLIHVQRPLQKNGNNNITQLWKMEFGPLNETIRAEDLKEIEEDYWRIRNNSRVFEISKRLPYQDFYLPIVFKCYYDSFYGFIFDRVRRNGPMQCPNADLCELPQRDDYRCIHSDAEYFSGPHMEPFTFHFSSNSFWSKDIGCYQ